MVRIAATALALALAAAPAVADWTSLTAELPSKEANRYWYQTSNMDVGPRDGVHDVLPYILQDQLRMDIQIPTGVASIFVNYDHYPNDTDVDALSEVDGVEVVYRSKYLNNVQVNMRADLSVFSTVAAIPGVVLVEYDWPKGLDMHEAVPIMGVDEVYNMARVADEGIGYDGTGVTIAVIDTGVDGKHVGLDDLDDDEATADPKILAHFDSATMTETEVGTDAIDDQGHGSHCAGIAAGTGAGQTAADGTPYKGVAPGAHVVSIYGCCGGGSSTTRGLEWAMVNQDKYNISVITRSIGLITGGIHVPFLLPSDGTASETRLVDAAVTDLGFLFFNSAGNSGGLPMLGLPSQVGAFYYGCNTISSPADCRECFAVGSLDKDLDLSYFSSRGTTFDGRIKPDITTIGRSVMSVNTNTGDGYTSKSGTSMATPLMAGIAALMKEANPCLSPADMKEIVHELSIPTSLPGPAELATNPGLLLDNTYVCSLTEDHPNNDFGWGIADPLAFVQAAEAKRDNYDMDTCASASRRVATNNDDDDDDNDTDVTSASANADASIDNTTRDNVVAGSVGFTLGAVVASAAAVSIALVRSKRAAGLADKDSLAQV